MTSAYSVNIESVKPARGRLRSALVAAGLALLDAREANDLSLREVARRAGVSAMAVYRHFPDKAALMRALATEGLKQLAAAQHAASDQAGGGQDGFYATGRAYVRFALENPALFRLILSDPPRLDMLSQPDGDVPDAMAFLRDNAAAVAGGADPRAIALRAWSTAHGLAMLMLDGQVAADLEIIDEILGPDPRSRPPA